MNKEKARTMPGFLVRRQRLSERQRLSSLHLAEHCGRAHPARVWQHVLLRHAVGLAAGWADADASAGLAEAFQQLAE